MPLPISNIRHQITDRAMNDGFDAIGFTRPYVHQSARKELVSFLQSNMHGDMGWLAKNATRRATPQRLWPQVKTVIVLAVNYAPHHDPLSRLKQRQKGVISVYAQGKDYHKHVKKSLKKLARWIAAHYGTDVKVFVDTAPVMEKHLGHNAGIGWQGKHTNLVSRHLGSWFFLGEIFTSLHIPADTRESDHCGSCQSCLDACPTKAITPYRINANLCISYLTIEHKGMIPRDLRVAIGNRIYGCDDCLAVCPWNKFATPSTDSPLSPEKTSAPLLRDLAALSAHAFARRFAGTPIRRLGRDRFIRNVLIAIGNSGDCALARTATAKLTDASALVRASAVWALSRLVTPEHMRNMRHLLARNEDNTMVIEEWNHVGSSHREPR